MKETISTEELNFLSQKNKELEIESLMTPDKMEAIKQGLAKACQQTDLNLVDYQVARASVYLKKSSYFVEIADGNGRHILMVDKESLQGVADNQELDAYVKNFERNLKKMYGCLIEYLKMPILMQDTTFRYIELSDEALNDVYEIKIFEIKSNKKDLKLYHLSDMDIMEQAYSQLEIRTQEEIGVEEGMAQKDIQTPPRQTVKKPVFSPLEEVENTNESHNLDLLYDVPLDITVVLGKTRRPIREILGINVGKIIELDKYADDPLEIYCNGKLIAEGEVVVVDENFGIQVTKLYQKEINNFR